jgi:hypothetical protein
VREEISLDHLMKDAEQDITREIKQAEEEAIDEQETAVRINRIFTLKKIRVRQIRNTHGATSKAVEECYSKCVNMPKMQSKYKMAETKKSEKIDDINYVLKVGDVSLFQLKRLIQKGKIRK